MSNSEIHVAVGVICANEKVLLAQRGSHQHLAGHWEFPGGKVANGETLPDALRRELMEELTIVVEAARPLIRVRHDYGSKRVLLDVWRVISYSGTPHGNENQPLAWVPVEELTRWHLPAADVPIVNALRLPPYYAITGPFVSPESFSKQLDNALAAGTKLLQLRWAEKLFAANVDLVRQVIHRCHAVGCQVVLNSAPDLVVKLGADGVHLNGHRLAACRSRPLSRELWVAASCHSPEDLARAAALEVDFAVLSPVKTTQSHPDAMPLGWQCFADWVDVVNFPVYALGGVGPADLETAWRHGAQGVAGIRDFGFG